MPSSRTCVPLADRVLEETTVEVLAGHDVVFLGLPHGQSAVIAKALPDDTVVIDCGADFRLTDSAAWEKFYGGEHAGSWPYGLPELGDQRAKIAQATRIAVPGCYPTVSTLAMAPAVAAGLVDSTGIVVVAASGTSGAGKAPKPHLLGSEVMGSATAYGVGGTHRHTPEIVQNLSALTDGTVKVSLHAAAGADAPRHPRHLLRADHGHRRGGLRRLREGLRRRAVHPPAAPGLWPQTKSVLGSNAVHVQVTVDEEAGRLVAVAAVDNLAKGTGGAAVQCMNLALGLARDHRPEHDRTRPVTEHVDDLTRHRDALAVVRLGRGAKVPDLGLGLHAVLGHRDRRPRPRSSATPRRCRPRPASRARSSPSR